MLTPQRRTAIREAQVKLDVLCSRVEETRDEIQSLLDGASDEDESTDEYSEASVAVDTLDRVINNLNESSSELAALL